MRNPTFIMTAALIFWEIAGFLPAEETASQPLPPVVLPPNALGLSLGYDANSLLTINMEYRRWLGNFGLSIAAGSAKDLDNYSTDWCFDFYGSLMLKVDEDNLFPNGRFSGALYGLIRSGYAGLHRTQWQNGGGRHQYYTQRIPIGLGIGFDFTAFSRISLPVEAGFEFFLPTGKVGVFIDMGHCFRF